MSTVSFSIVNPHCLENIRAVTASQEVTAVIDICDTQGRRLWSKGQTVSESLQEKLLSRTLRTPLELSLDVPGGVSPEVASRRARELYEQDPVVAMLVGDEAKRAFAELGKAKVERALKLLLTCTEDNGSKGFDHAVKVALIAAAMALRAKLDDKDITTTVLGGLAHDLGELYIDPEYLNTKRVLTLNEWRQVVAHPLIGQQIVQTLTALPKSVADVVGSHHERADGTGYPMQTSERNQSKPSQIVALVESLMGPLQAEDNPAARVSLATRLVAGETAPDVLKLLAPLVRSASTTVSVPATFDVLSAQARTEALAKRIKGAMEYARQLQEPTPELRKALERSMNVLLRLDVSLRATGLLSLSAETVTLESHSAEVFFEFNVVPREIEWRLRNLARSLSLTYDTLPDADASPDFLRFVELLSPASLA